MSVLALAVCVVQAGARSYVAIAEWAHDWPLGPGFESGLTIRRAPRASPKIRRLLQKIDPQALDRAASNWLISRAASTGPTSPSAEPVRIITSPKSHESQGHAAGFSRWTVSPHASAANPDGRAVHLLAAFETGSGIVPGNR